MQGSEPRSGTFSLAFYRNGLEGLDYGGAREQSIKAGVEAAVTAQAGDDSPRVRGVIMDMVNSRFSGTGKNSHMVLTRSPITLGFSFHHPKVFCLQLDCHTWFEGKDVL